MNNSNTTHYVAIYWRYFWNSQRFTKTHLFRDYPERGYGNVSPEEGKTLCGESIPNYWRDGTKAHNTCKRCRRIARHQHGDLIRACQRCGSPNIVSITPYEGVGIVGWGERCKDCGHFRDISAEVLAETADANGE